MPYGIDTTHRSPNYDRRNGATIALLVLHATVGSANSALGWLCNPQSNASTHYLINKQGHIYQLVGDTFRAWHAGISAWRGVSDCNDYSIGVELENDNSGNDPYPAAQIDALKWLTTKLFADYPTLRGVASHNEVALPSGRKSDPAGFPLILFRAWVASLRTPPPPPAPIYTEHSPIFAAPGAKRAQLQFTGKHGGYTALDVDTILDAYYELAVAAGVDPVVAIAQMLHETGDLTSFWSQRPQRNPAGIGVTGQYSENRPIDTARWKYNTQRLRWEVGLSFRAWATDSIPVQLGRLLSYALPAATGTQEQQALIQRSNAARPLPIRARGSAQTLKALGHAHNPAGFGWAWEGEEYGLAIARKANKLVSELKWPSD